MCLKNEKPSAPINEPNYAVSEMGSQFNYEGPPPPPGQEPPPKAKAKPEEEVFDTPLHNRASAGAMGLLRGTKQTKVKM